MNDIEEGRKATPGPWRWWFHGGLGRWVLVGHGEQLVDVGGPPGQELSPDQNLIAAAPLLLVAVELLHNLLADLDARKELTFGSSVWTLLRDAIAKAKGESR